MSKLHTDLQEVLLDNPHFFPKKPGIKMIDEHIYFG